MRPNRRRLVTRASCAIFRALLPADPQNVYLDNAASTRVDEDVVRAMSPFFTTHFGNPSSAHHQGIAAARGIAQAREQLAKAVGAAPEQVIFTSGGTEANGLGILGAKARGPRVVATVLEHPSALGSARMRGGEQLTVIGATREGVVSVEDFVRACTSEVGVATCMLVSNEMGTVQPIAQLAARLRAAGFRGHFHVDAVQAFGKIPVHLGELGCDSMALSSHKIHGPKGVGALVVRKGVHVAALWGGGNHESGVRPGTENAPGIVGFGEAAARAHASLTETHARLLHLRAQLVQSVQKAIPEVRIVAETAPCAPHIVAFLFPNVRAEVLLHALEARGVYVSAGAACASRDHEPSPLARALGISPRDGLIRISLAKTNTEEDIARVAAVLPESLKEARP